MSEDYRIEGVETCSLRTHLDFCTMPRVYVLRKMNDGVLWRVKRPRSAGWEVGALVSLPRSEVLAAAF